MPLPNQTCPNNSWCAFEAIDNYTFIVQLIYTIVLIFIAFHIFKSYAKLKKYIQKQQQLFFIQNQQQFGNIYMIVHYLAFGWLICSFIKCLLNLAVYWIYMQQDFQYFHQISHNLLNQTLNSDQSELALMIQSSIFTFFDFMCTFLLLLLLIIIPYRWLTIILLSTNQQVSTNQISIQTRITLSRCFKVLKIIKIYFKYIRQFFALFLFVQPFLLFFLSVGCWLMTIKQSCVIFSVFYINLQILLILLFYFYGFYITQKIINQKLLIMNKNDSSTLKCQYFALTCILLIRIIINLSLRVTGWVSGESNQHCSQISQNIKQKIFNAISLSFGHSIMHILPILITLYIYRPSIEERKRYNNLLNTPNKQQFLDESERKQKIHIQKKDESLLTHTRESQYEYKTKIQD